VTARKAVLPQFAGLPPAARAYVWAVVVAGALCLIDATTRLHFDQPGLFAFLAALGIATSAIKIDLPLGRSQSNLSLSLTILPTNKAHRSPVFRSYRLPTLSVSSDRRLLLS